MRLYQERVPWDVTEISIARLRPEESAQLDIVADQVVAFLLGKAVYLEKDGDHLIYQISYDHHHERALVRALEMAIDRQIALFQRFADKVSPLVYSPSTDKLSLSFARGENRYLKIERIAA